MAEPSARLSLVLTLFACACGAAEEPGDSDGTTSEVSTSSTVTTTSATGDDPSATAPDASTASTTGDTEVAPPTDSAEALEAWLAGGAYRSWPSESQIHASSGPHGGNVRTFVNPALADSLAADTEHLAGAASVKELYGSGTDAIVGYAVMVKLAPDSAEGDGWYWYERLDATVYADDTGVKLCTGCHAGGSDYVLTPWPLQ
ncbi:hypothetical protein [Nannocystis bainbridge]|uniref:Cytochrome P460 domain-containing protein n=1 Tax=Nannocystis bainbridge TaxID=2995303 RepID=A0ABT5E2Z5_9BACT|nr:hypothetical protein [Nannocystis bainbridge]MDC0719679.1 hypothetical protein [Nannocystis bainbridge]